jgi:hypothetical protein
MLILCIFKCYDVSFVGFNKLLITFKTNLALLLKRVLSNITKPMGLFLWKHNIQSSLLAKNKFVLNEKVMAKLSKSDHSR